jgi:hypothetical protein
VVDQSNSVGGFIRIVSGPDVVVKPMEKSGRMRQWLSNKSSLASKWIQSPTGTLKLLNPETLELPNPETFKGPNKSARS